MLLREVHRVDGNEVQKTHFSKDLQLASSILTDLLVVKGAVGGERFGAGNIIYYSDSTPAANLLRSVSSVDSHYQFYQQPSQEDLNLLPVGAKEIDLQFQTSVQLSQVHYLHLKPLHKSQILLGLCQKRNHVSVRQLLCCLMYFQTILL